MSKNPADDWRTGKTKADHRGGVKPAKAKPPLTSGPVDLVAAEADTPAKAENPPTS